MHVKVDINQPTLAPIDVKFVVAEGLQEKTEAKRRPYVKLIRRWAQQQGCAELGEVVAGRLAVDGGATEQTDLTNSSICFTRNIVRLTRLSYW